MKKCLIVVDYQNDFVCGPLGFPAAAALEPFIAAKIEEYRAAGGDIIFTLDTHGDDYFETQEGRNLPVFHCAVGTDGHALYGSVAGLIRKSDKCFYKSAFGSGDMYDYLKKQNFAGIELCGVVTDICVISNAVLAKTALPEVPVAVDARCVASNDPALNFAALDVMASLQIKITGRTA